jgi:membrane-bound lytic murein transglycosylase B
MDGRRRVIAHVALVTVVLAGTGGSVAAVRHGPTRAAAASRDTSVSISTPTEVATHPPTVELKPVDGGTPKHLPLPPKEHKGGPMAPVDLDALGIPARVLQAYRAAADHEAYYDPGCHLSWTVVAAIGRVESDHAHLGSVRTDGTAVPPILGPLLSGSNGFAAISDSDGGRLDGNRTWDRAVGPMQFIPQSWALHGRDANGDGKTDPQNVDDAAQATAGYLCTGYRDLSRPHDLRWAIHGYNQSWPYVRAVLAWAKAYGGHVAVIPDAGPGKRKHHSSSKADRKRARSSSPSSAGAGSTGSGSTSTPSGSGSTGGSTSGSTPTPTASSDPTPTSSGSDPTPTSCPTPDPTSTPDPTVSPSPDGCPTPTVSAIAAAQTSESLMTSPEPTPTPAG